MNCSCNGLELVIKTVRLTDAAVVPTQARQGDAGFDLVATDVVVTDKYLEYKTGLAVEIPEGYFGMLLARSSVSKLGLHLANAAGIIDSGYRGEICLRFYGYDAKEQNIYEVGDRVGQMIILQLPTVKYQLVTSLDASDRGEGGFGHTGV